MDIILGLLLLIITSPLLIIVAIIIKIESPGPVFADTPFRVGMNGKPFKLYKFRSMIKDAQKLLETDPRFAKLYEEYKQNSYKGNENDPRLIKIGHFIRKYSIDEIPEALNVLKGDMSFVGPRAYYAFELRDQQKNFPGTGKYIDTALSVKPGLTGLWQVSGRSEINFDRRIVLDATYAEKKSILFDLWIIFKTPIAVIQAKGSH